ncbi:MAG TPA: LysR family transcriptional regulator [Pseudonocardia sp.]|jgi:DNA-binding transcriptional LysR family regulator
MTLTQLSAFVLVARLGSVKAAAAALGVSEPAVSQALASLRKYFGDSLLIRGPNGMELTEGGNRLLGVAAQMVALGAEAEEAVRTARGQPAQLRLVADSTLVELVSGPLAEAFSRRTSGSVEVAAGVATTAEMAVLVSQRLADLAIGPRITADPGLALVSEPIVRGTLVVLGSSRSAPRGPLTGWPWLVDPSGTDPHGDVGQLLRGLGVPEQRVSVYPNQTAAWEAAAAGTGVAPAVSHLAAPQLRRRDMRVVPTPLTPRPICWHATTLRPDRRSPSAGSLRRFLGTPEGMRLLRSPAGGVPPSRFRPPVYVTIWS